MDEKIKKAALIIIAALYLCALTWAGFKAAEKMRSENALTTFDIAAAYTDIKSLSLLSGRTLPAETDVLKKEGLTSLVLEAANKKEGEAEAKRAGLGIIYKADRDKGTDLKSLPSRARVMFINNIIYDRETFFNKGFKPCLLEFYRPVGFEDVMLKDILTAHTVKDEEMDALSFSKLKARFVRARVERRYGILYVKFKYKGGDPAGNEALVAGISSELKAAGEVPAPYLSNPYTAGSGEYLREKKAFALLIALIMPLVAFYTGFRYLKSPYAKFSVMFLVAFTGGLLVSAVLTDAVFMTKLEQFTGVKYALTIPVAVVLLLLAFKNRDAFTKQGLKATLWLVLLFAVLFAVASVRSGNFNVPLFPYEERLRELLERVFWARPRAKEFLIGYPCMLLGLHLLADKKLQNYKLPAIIFISAGVFGLTSVVNTFCHPHIPFLMSLLRSVYGAILGTLGGYILITISKLLRKS